jgi:uncharacterized protein
MSVEHEAVSTAVPTDLFAIPLAEDQFIVYAPLKHTAFLANGALVRAISRLRPVGTHVIDSDAAILSFLNNLQLLDASAPHASPPQIRSDPKPTIVTLFLTTACNLRCTYCYASAGDTPLKRMDMPVAERGIGFVAKNAKELGVPSITINYHGGGEPTANWSVLTGSFDFAQRVAAELELEVHAYSATNGVLSDDKARWIAAHLDAAMVSYDGPAAQDVHRPTVGGRPSSRHVEDTLRIFDQANFRYGIRITVTKDQIQELPVNVAYILQHFNPQRIHVEPAYPIGRWRQAPSSESIDFVASYREADRIARTFGHDLFYSGARVGRISRHFCGVTRDNFSLSPDGNVSACFEAFSESNDHASIFFYGQPSPERTGYRFNLPVLNALRAQTVDNRSFCNSCFAKWNCAGDCYHRSVVEHGASEFSGSDRCHVTRELTKDQLLRRIQQAGGIVWHDVDAAATDLLDSL